MKNNPRNVPKHMRNYIENFMWNYGKGSSHKRGIMLEGLIGEFERGTGTKEVFIEILSRIASDMK